MLVRACGGLRADMDPRRYVQVCACVCGWVTNVRGERSRVASGRRRILCGLRIGGILCGLSVGGALWGLKFAPPPCQGVQSIQSVQSVFTSADWSGKPTTRFLIPRKFEISKIGAGQSMRGVVRQRGCLALRIPEAGCGMRETGCAVRVNRRHPAKSRRHSLCAYSRRHSPSA